MNNEKNTIEFGILSSEFFITFNTLQHNITQSINNMMNCVLKCAGCGKVEDETSPFQKCSRCKIVKYCSRDCQVSDYSQHKHDCRLFGEGHAYYEEDCPICLMQLPLETMEFAIKSCCSKKICDGCIWAAKKRGMGENWARRPHQKLMLKLLHQPENV